MPGERGCDEAFWSYRDQTLEQKRATHLVLIEIRRTNVMLALAATLNLPTSRTR